VIKSAWRVTQALGGGLVEEDWSDDPGSGVLSVMGIVWV
jgi:hypothetical protein